MTFTAPDLEINLNSRNLKFFIVIATSDAKYH